MKKIINLAAALALLAFACGDEEGVTPPPPPGHTPADVIESVELSFNQRDIEILKNSLSPYFIFYFDPADAGQNPPGSRCEIPESRSYTEFWRAVGNMFTEAYSISLSIPADQVGTPGENETTYRADNISIHLVVMIDELSGYLVDQGYCHFEFEKYKNEQGQDRWRITKWWDDTEGGGEAPAGVERVPLWYILSLYEKPA